MNVKEVNKALISLDDISKVFRVLAKNWFYFFVFPIIGGFFAYFYTYRMPDVYAAKAKIMLESNETLDVTNSFYNSYYAAYSQITNQMRVLESYDFLKKVTEKIDLQISYFIVGRIKVTESFNESPYKVEVLSINNRLYEKPINMKIINKDQFELSYELNDKNIVNRHEFGQKAISSNYVLLINSVKRYGNKIPAQTVLVDYQFVVHSQAKLLSKYRAGLSVRNMEYSSIVSVELKDEVPERAVVFLDSLCDTYIDYSVNNQIMVNIKTVDYIDDQLKYVNSLLEEIEVNLDAYRHDKPVLLINDEQSKYVNDLVLLESEKRKSELYISQIHSLEDYILNTSDKHLIPPAVYITEDDPFLSGSLANLYDLQFKRNEMLFQKKAAGAEIVRHDEMMDLLRKDILTYLVNTVTAIEERVASLDKQTATLEILIRNLPRSLREKVNLERKKAINEKMYLFLLETRENAVIARASIIPRSKVLERARSVGIVGPDKKRIITTSIAVGFALAVFIALINMLFFEKIENVNDLLSITKIPVLGGVPFAASQAQDRKLINAESKSNLTESFRSVRTNLQYINPDC